MDPSVTLWGLQGFGGTGRRWGSLGQGHRLQDTPSLPHSPQGPVSQASSSRKPSHTVGPGESQLQLCPQVCVWDPALPFFPFQAHHP